MPILPYLLTRCLLFFGQEQTTFVSASLCSIVMGHVTGHLILLYLPLLSKDMALILSLLL